MAAKSYSMEFDGYWREHAISGLPAKSGVYCVYACLYNENAKTVDLKRLLYIGESADVQDRVKNHEKWPDWRKKLGEGQVLCFSAAVISGESDRQRVEAAEIFKHKPPCNTEYVNNFPFDKTTVTNSGKAALLQAQFTVERTEESSAKAAGAYGRGW